MEEEIDIEFDNKDLKKWIIKYYGKRCPDYEEDCPCCEAWKHYDWLIQYD